MKKELMQIYICEHCKRKMFSPGAMGLHEKQCKENPKNKHKCFDWCKHLQKGFDQERGETTFTCKVKDLSLYSYKLERFTCHKQRIKELIRMPLECDLYQYANAETEDIDFKTLYFNE